jgi:hypothetical protein
MVGKVAAGGLVMSTEPKRIPILLPCPNCSQRATVNLSKVDLEAGLKFGEFDAYHIMCNHSWTVRLDPTMRASIQQLIETEYS